MEIETRPLRSLDDAKRLRELVYSAYGLTYHRGFLYHPEQVISLNARGLLRSTLAFDRQSGEILGHLATIRPFFELSSEEDLLTPTSSVEIGLSLVSPNARGQSIQGQLAQRCVALAAAENPGLTTVFSKCVTA
ncbi:MAG: hypothetical protein VYD19_01115, partial [Myxococcota bacterium]|nr:hypothetical protein [Myxococcota bacterium]